MMERFAVSNLLIVESDSDRWFIELLIKHMNVTIEVSKPVCSVDDFECLEGLSEKQLTRKLYSERLDKYDKIGILVDANSAGIEARVELVRRAMLAVEGTTTKDEKPIQTAPETNNKLVHCLNCDVKFAIGIIHVNGKGELETLLREIKTQDSIYADCLEAWRNCVEKENKENKKIKQKDFDKLWLNNYFRYDTCKNSERGQAEKRCSKEAAFKKPGIWNLDHPALDDLKTFLRLFQ